MSKFTFVLLLSAVAVSIQGVPVKPDRIAEVGKSDNWEEIHKILSESSLNDWAPVNGDVSSLKGGPDRQVFGKSVSVFKSSTNINGQKSEFSKGHAVINNNGQIEEYEFKP